jgi:hypothetical protein
MNKYVITVEKLIGAEMDDFEQSESFSVHSCLLSAELKKSFQDGYKEGEAIGKAWCGTHHGEMLTNHNEDVIKELDRHATRYNKESIHRFRDSIRQEVIGSFTVKELVEEFCKREGVDKLYKTQDKELHIGGFGAARIIMVKNGVEK